MIEQVLRRGDDSPRAHERPMKLHLSQSLIFLCFQIQKSDPSLPGTNRGKHNHCVHLHHIRDVVHPRLMKGGSGNTQNPFQGRGHPGGFAGADVPCTELLPFVMIPTEYPL